MTDKQQEVESLITALAALEPSNFETLKEYRSAIVKVLKQGGAKLGEGAEEVFDLDEARLYIKKLLQQGYIECTKLPAVPDKLKIKVRNAAVRNIIKEELRAIKVLSRTQEEEPLKREALSYILKARTIAELRSALNLWIQVQAVFKKDSKQPDAYVMNICKEIEDEMTELEYYKQVSNELIAAMTYDDEKTLLAMKVHKLKAQDLGRGAIAKELGISEKKVRTLLGNYEFSFSAK